VASRCKPAAARWLADLAGTKPLRIVLLVAFVVSDSSLVAHAQSRLDPAAVPVLGYLSSGPSGSRLESFAAFQRALNEGGFSQGRNIAIEYRWAADEYDRLPALAADLVQRRVAVIAATGGPVVALAAKRATSTIPVVFTAVSDPLKYGLIASYNRPGGNLTGSGGYVAELDAKRFELLRELVPRARRIGALVNPNRPGVDGQISDLATAAQTAGAPLTILRAGDETALDAVFSGLASEPVEALVIAADPFFNSRREQLIALLARHAIPAIYQWREFAMAGGLMSYGPSVTEAYHQAGAHVARILKGEKPADLPVVRPARFELVVNLRTAKAYGLKIPPALIARADEVIE
jgi:putative ABC transport system substrate-binding protein